MQDYAIHKFEYQLLRALGRAMPYLTVLFLLGFLWSAWNLWGTRVAAVPGTYVASGPWGRARLDVEKTGVFTMVAHHRNESTGKDEDTQTVHGTWKAGSRDSFWREITFEPFIGLAGWNRGNSYEFYPVTFGPYWLHGPGFQMDPRASIFFRSSWRPWQVSSLSAWLSVSHSHTLLSR